jgi:hypothetical protein
LAFGERLHGGLLGGEETPKPALVGQSKQTKGESQG